MGVWKGLYLKEAALPELRRTWGCRRGKGDGGNGLAAGPVPPGAAQAG